MPISDNRPAFRNLPGADLVEHHQRRRLPSDILARRHGCALAAALRVEDARRVLLTWDRLVARDRDAGRPVSPLLHGRLEAARLALADAEHALLAARTLMSATQDDEDDVDPVTSALVMRAAPADAASKPLTEIERLVLDLLLGDPKMKPRMVAEKTGLTPVSIYSARRRLRDRGEL